MEELIGGKCNFCGHPADSCQCQQELPPPTDQGEGVYGGPCIYCDCPDGSCNCQPPLDPENEFKYQDGPPLTEERKEGIKGKIGPGPGPKGELGEIGPPGEDEFTFTDGIPLNQDPCPGCRRLPHHCICKGEEEISEEDRSYQEGLRELREERNQLTLKNIKLITEENRIMEETLKDVASGKQEDAPQFARGILEHIQALRSE